MLMDQINLFILLVCFKDQLCLFQNPPQSDEDKQLLVSTETDV